MIADILYDLNLFVDGRGYAGRVQELKPPVIKPLVMEYQAGGMAAPVDIPMGRFEKMEAEATLGSYSKEVLKLMRILPGEKFAFVMRGAMASDDGSKTGVIVTLRGTLTELDSDTWKPGEAMPLKMAMNSHYYKLEVGGEVIHEIDPINYIAIINGVDQLEVTRQHLAI